MTLASSTNDITVNLMVGAHGWGVAAIAAAGILVAGVIGFLTRL